MNSLRFRPILNKLGFPSEGEMSNFEPQLGILLQITIPVGFAFFSRLYVQMSLLVHKPNRFGTRLPTRTTESRDLKRRLLSYLGEFVLKLCLLRLERVGRMFGSGRKRSSSSNSSISSIKVVNNEASTRSDLHVRPVYLVRLEHLRLAMVLILPSAGILGSMFASLSGRPRR